MYIVAQMSVLPKQFSSLLLAIVVAIKAGTCSLSVCAKCLRSKMCEEDFLNNYAWVPHSVYVDLTYSCTESPVNLSVRLYSLFYLDSTRVFEGSLEGGVGGGGLELSWLIFSR